MTFITLVLNFAKNLMKNFCPTLLYRRLQCRSIFFYWEGVIAKNQGPSLFMYENGTFREGSARRGTGRTTSPRSGHLHALANTLSLGAKIVCSSKIVEMEPWRGAEHLPVFALVQFPWDSPSPLTLWSGRWLQRSDGCFCRGFCFKRCSTSVLQIVPLCWTSTLKLQFT